MIEEDDYQFDVSTIEPSTIADLKQEGNYLIGMTNQGVKFRQHIGSKILNKVDGKYVLQEMKIQ